MLGCSPQLQVHEYVKILDQSTGSIRVESGGGSSKQVFLGPHDKVLDSGKKKAVEVDGEHAVLVRDKSSGQVRLVTEKQLFIPGPNEVIETLSLNDLQVRCIQYIIVYSYLRAHFGHFLLRVFVPVAALESLALAQPIPSTCPAPFRRGSGALRK